MDVQKTMEFILEQQAAFAAGMQELEARSLAHQADLDDLSGNSGNLHTIADTDAEFANQEKITRYREDHILQCDCDSSGNQSRERGITDFHENCVFVRKIDVKRGGGYAELCGDSTNRRGSIPFFHKQLLGRVENLSSPLQPLSFSFSTAQRVRLQPSFHAFLLA